ncbi:MAG: RNA methyltransferase [Flavobacterium sp.]|nr:MAG: RNA methyltransferase [Flavobacterium sp.]
MLSKSQVSFIKSLHQKKFRRQQGLFIVEGIKSVRDFITSGFGIHSIYYTAEHSGSLSKPDANIKLFEVNNAEIDKISTLQTPQGILAVVELPKIEQFDPSVLKGKFTIVLDGIQDPGNLGTIIRTADWFGISQIICSEDTADAYNPKTVQASMGSLSRVKLSYLSLPEIIKNLNLPVFGAFLDGKNIYDISWGDEGLVILGNEGQGISDELRALVDKKVTIPRSGEAESLNVAISTAIFCSEITRSTR